MMKDLDRADWVRRYESGQSIETIAREVGVSFSLVRQHLARVGTKTRTTKGMTDAAMEKRLGKSIAEIVAEMADLYRSGLSLHDVGERFGITRPAVVKRLRECGVELRTMRDSSQLRFAKMTEEERRQVTEAAHAAVRGVPRSFEEKCRVAEGKARVESHVSPLERQFAEWLNARGVAPTRQLAVGPYNIDLALEETCIAVEIFGGNWHNHGRSAARFRQRTDHLIDAGWLPVIIWHAPHAPLSEAAADYVVALHEGVRRGESVGRQERVIWGDGRLKTVRKRQANGRPVVADP